MSPCCCPQRVLLAASFFVFFGGRGRVRGGGRRELSCWLPLQGCILICQASGHRRSQPRLCAWPSCCVYNKQRFKRRYSLVSFVVAQHLESPSVFVTLGRFSQLLFFGVHYFKNTRTYVYLATSFLKRTNQRHQHRYYAESEIGA
jgi:hypothetical protein